MSTAPLRTRTPGFLADAATLASGTFVAQLVLLAATPLLTRLFSPADFGVFGLLVALAAFVAVFGTLRLEAVIPAAATRGEALTMVQVSLVTSVLVAALTGIFIAIFREDLRRLFDLPSTTALWLVPILAIALSSYASLRAFLLREARFQGIRSGQIVRVFAATAVSLGCGAAGLMSSPGGGLALGQATGDVIYGASMSRHIRPSEWRLLCRPRISAMLGVLRRARGMIAALTTAATITAIYSRIPVIVIAAAYGPITAGFYILAERLIAAPVALVAVSIGDVYRQRAAHAHRNGSPFDALMLRVLTTTSLVSIVPFAVAVVAAPSFVGPVFGSQWQPAGDLVAIMLAGTFVAFNTSIVDKSPVIVGARAYILCWSVLRLTIEVFGATLAWSGRVDIHGYLTCVVALRSAAYIMDAVVGYHLAKQTGSGRSNPTRTPSPTG